MIIPLGWSPDRDGGGWVGVVVQSPSGRWVLIKVEEEKIARAALGDDEFERRVMEEDLKILTTRPPKWWEIWKKA